MPTEPAGSLPFRLDGVPLRVDQHFAAADMVGGRDYSFLSPSAR
jgi:hypothetical protein